MNPRTIVALVVALAALGVTAWKGPSVWGAISSAIVALCVLVLPLLASAAKSDPKIMKVEQYVEDLESELESVPGAEKNLAALKEKHGRS